MIIGKTTVLAGPSGVGKSSITNLSSRRHRWRRAASVRRSAGQTYDAPFRTVVEESTYMMDTPGFSSLYIEDLEPEALKDFFPEFEAYEDECRFLGCVHIGERECGVKTAVQEHKIGRVCRATIPADVSELKRKRKQRRKQPLRILYKKWEERTMIILSPSILGADFTKLGEQVAGGGTRQAQYIHLDDGWRAKARVSPLNA